MSEEKSVWYNRFQGSTTLSTGRPFRDCTVCFLEMPRGIGWCKEGLIDRENGKHGTRPASGSSYLCDAVHDERRWREVEVGLAGKQYARRTQGVLRKSAVARLLSSQRPSIGHSRIPTEHNSRASGSLLKESVWFAPERELSCAAVREASAQVWRD